MNQKPRVSSCFLRFIIYNLLFLLLQLLYIFYSEHSFIHAIEYPLPVYLELLVALFIQIVLYIFLSIGQTILLWVVLLPWCKDKNQLENCQLYIYFLSIIALLSVNGYFFPLSKFSRLFFPELPTALLLILMLASLSILTLLALLAVGYYAKKHPLSLMSFIMGLLLWNFIPATPVTPSIEEALAPNLIIIGIDSLSPENVSPELTPNLYAFLNDSVHFKKTISPLARTYSAWTTILTGLYPLHHFARENLYPPQWVKHDASFAWQFQCRGYRTVFATDDRRFNNLGKDFGFEEIVGPHIGVNDVLLGSFYDFPLSNPLINLRISQWLFPYNYLNRAGFFSYYPSSFDHALQRTLDYGPKNKPLLMAVHFTLAHWPYSWASTSPTMVKDEYDVHDREYLYEQAVHRADQQVGAFLHALTQVGALNNAMLIVLSDHGEVLYKKGSRRTSLNHYQGTMPGSYANYLKRNTNTELEMSVGHGSDLLSPSQNECVLGFKLFQQGKIISKPQAISVPVALLDIAPTIAAFFQFPLKEKVDGIALIDTLIDGVIPVNHRAFMLESGMLPNQSLSKEKIIESASLLFKVNPATSLLEVRKDQFASINAMKLYGLIQDNWLMALYPDGDRYITIVLNLNNNDWTDEPFSAFAKSSPREGMLKQLRQFYDKDLALYPLVLTH